MSTRGRGPETPAQKKAREARNAKNPGPSDEARGVWKWMETSKDDWVTPLIPDGDACTARIRRSSRNSDGTHSYFCYRSGECIAITRDAKGKSDGLEMAKRAVQRGEKTPMSAILSYVSNHPLEIPPFLALTESERKTVRAEYPHVAPPEGKIRAHQQAGGARRRGDAADLSDPSTRAFLEAEQRRQMALPLPGGGAPAEPGEQSSGGAGKLTTRGALAALRKMPGARPTLVGSWENPAKAGTKRHAGYQLVLDGCAAGKTVKELLASGADEMRLAKCIVKGLLDLGGK